MERCRTSAQSATFPSQIGGHIVISGHVSNPGSALKYRRRLFVCTSGSTLLPVDALMNEKLLKRRENPAHRRNALNRRNVRNVPYGVDRIGRVQGPTDALMPILPSAGFVIEF